MATDASDLDPAASDFSIAELLAAWIAHELTDDDRLFVGAGLLAPRAGALLAHLSHAPNMKLSMGLVSANVRNEPVLVPFRFSTDYRMSRWAESEVIHNDIFDRPDQTADVFFVGGVQIDRFGNTNLIGTRSAERAFGFRGPGSFGTTSMAHYAKRYYIFAADHSPMTFVPQADYISVFGFGDGGDHRSRLGLDQYNSGPAAVITPLAILDFQTDDHRMRLKSVHPGVTIDEVQSSTGFDLEIADDVTETTPPTLAELEMLRSRIDPYGDLRP